MGTMTIMAEKIKQSILTIVDDVGKDLPLSNGRVLLDSQ
jgi:hypothetical protein